MKKIGKWSILEEKDVSPSKWYPIHQHKVKLPNGKIIDDYFVAKIGDVSMVFAVTKSNHVIFVRQYKHGAGEIMLELPAGFIEKNKNPEQAAIDELREETGFVAGDIEPLGKIVNNPTKSTQVIHGFFSKELSMQKAQDLDDNEEIEVVLVPLKSVDEKVMSGEIVATDSLAFIYLAKLKHPEIFR